MARTACDYLRPPFLFCRAALILFCLCLAKSPTPPVSAHAGRGAPTIPSDAFQVKADKLLKIIYRATRRKKSVGGQRHDDSGSGNGPDAIAQLAELVSFHPEQAGPPTLDVAVQLNGERADELQRTRFAIEAVLGVVAPPARANPIDDPSFFVRQHYLDFLNREPDADGLQFWTNQTTNCGASDPLVCRVNVSAAFFLSIEFQETGYLVERIYKTAFGDATGNSTLNGAHTLPVPVVHFSEFLPDAQEIGSTPNQVIVNQGNWQQQLEVNKQTFTLEFVQRQRFASAFPASLAPAQFVNTLFANAGVTPTDTERNAAVAEFGGAADSSNQAARARALRDVAENPALAAAEKNRAFVLMQYFGYLRRDPNGGQDTDHTGYDFWLRKLNQFGGDFQQAEMVKAFITSDEYRQRFAGGSVISLSANPDPITAGPCGGCGSGSTDREAATALTIQESGGVGGTVTAIAMTLRDNNTNEVLASGEFDSNGVTFFAGSNRLPAGGRLVAAGVGVHYARSLAGRSATLTYTVRVTDDLGNRVARDLAVQVST